MAGQGFRGKGGAEAGETPVAGRLGEWGGCCAVLLATGSVRWIVFFEGKRGFFGASTKLLSPHGCLCQPGSCGLAAGSVPVAVPWCRRGAATGRWPGQSRSLLGPGAPGSPVSSEQPFLKHRRHDLGSGHPKVAAAGTVLRAQPPVNGMVCEGVVTGRWK